MRGSVHPMDSIEAARRLEALGNPTRLAVYRVLVRAGPDGLAFGEIQGLVGGAGSTLSHHVATLARAGLIEQERRGRETVNRVRFGDMNALLDFLTAECCKGVCVRPVDDADADAGEAA